jgi:hypothetical protein
VLRPPAEAQAAKPKTNAPSWQSVCKRVLSCSEREPAACSEERIRDPPLDLLRRWRPYGAPLVSLGGDGLFLNTICGGMRASSATNTSLGLAFSSC